MSFFSDDLALDLVMKRLSAREIRMIGAACRSTRELADDGCVFPERDLHMCTSVNHILVGWHPSRMPPRPHIAARQLGLRQQNQGQKESGGTQPMAWLAHLRS